MQAKRCVIASGQSLSEAVELGGEVLWGIGLPPGFDDTLVTFQADIDGTNNFRNLYTDDGSEVVMVVVANSFVAADAARSELGLTRFMPRIKVRCGSAVAPTAVGAERVLILFTERPEKGGR